MRKNFLLLPLFLIFINISSARADQLAWLTTDELNQAMDYINKNEIKEVILFCGCCDKDIQEKVLVSKIYYRQVKNSKEYYEIVIEGTTPETKPVKKAVDLAYVHIKKDDKAVCLGLEMGFKCDPCTKPFGWF
jgi:hypothetical protein